MWVEDTTSGDTLFQAAPGWPLAQSPDSGYWRARTRQNSRMNSPPGSSQLHLGLPIFITHSQDTQGRKQERHSESSHPGPTCLCLLSMRVGV